MLDAFMSYLPLILMCCLFIIPYGMLANETYKAVYKVKKVPILQAILNYIPFYNYISTRKYLYGSALPVIIMSCMSIACFVWRAVSILVWGSTDPVMMLISSYVAISGVLIWYITMMFTSFYTAHLTRRGIFTLLLGTLVAPFGAFIVSKNIRKYFKQTLEVDSEFGNNN